MIGFPHFGHFNPVSFASGLYHTSFPSLIINAASNFEPSFRLNPFITPVGSPSISFATCASVSVFSQILLHRIKSHSEHLYVAGVLIIGFPHFGQTKSVLFSNGAHETLCSSFKTKAAEKVPPFFFLNPDITSVVLPASRSATFLSVSETPAMVLKIEKSQSG